MATIRIPPVLRSEAAGNRTFEVQAPTVKEALDKLVAEYPALDGRVLEGGSVPTFLNVFVDGEDVRLDKGLATEVGEGSTILLLPAVAGGAVACEAASALRASEIATMERMSKRFFTFIACAQRA